MSPLDIALITLIIIWTIIFVIVAITMVVLLIGLKKALDKINNILDQGEDMARGLGAVGKVTAGSLAGILVKAAGDRLNGTSQRAKNSTKKN